MMLFRNATVLQISKVGAERLDEFIRDAREVLGEKTRDPGPLESESRGWAEVYPGTGYAFAAGPHSFFLSQRIARRALPARAVAYELSKRVNKIHGERGTKPSGREFRELREQVICDLLPNAPIVPSAVLGLIDVGRQLIIIDTGSRKAAEQWLSHLRETVDHLAAIPFDPEEAPASLMTSWVTDPKSEVAGLPDSLMLGDSVVLADPSEGGATVRCARQELESEEVREHLRSGKRVRRLALFHAERMSFELSDTLQLAKLSALDVYAEKVFQEDQSAAEEFAARAAATQLMLGELLDLLMSTFGIRPFVSSREKQAGAASTQEAA